MQHTLLERINPGHFTAFAAPSSLRFIRDGSAFSGLDNPSVSPF
jgi:hypothetical protein